MQWLVLVALLLLPVRVWGLQASAPITLEDGTIAFGIPTCDQTPNCLCTENDDAGINYDATDNQLFVGRDGTNPPLVGSAPGVITERILMSIGDEVDANVYVMVFGNANDPQFQSYRARGSELSPTAVQSTDRLLHMRAVGYTTAGASTPWSQGGVFEFQPTQTFTRECVGGANHGLACLVASDCPGGNCTGGDAGTKFVLKLVPPSSELSNVDSLTTVLDITTGALTYTSTGTGNGTVLLPNDSIGDAEVDFATVTCADMTMSDCGAIIASDLTCTECISAAEISALGTLTDGNFCQAGAGSTLDCDVLWDNDGDCTSNTVCLGGHGHSQYLTAEVDGSTTNELQNIFQTIDTSSGVDPVADTTTDTLQMTGTAPITVTGSEGPPDSVTIALTQNAGTDVTVDLEEETHAGEHYLAGGDAVTATNLASACTNAQVLGGTVAGTGVECQTDDDVPESGDFGAAADLESDGSLSIDVVAAAEMADADHGDVAWSGGVATVQDTVCTLTNQYLDGTGTCDTGAFLADGVTAYDTKVWIGGAWVNRTFSTGFAVGVSAITVDDTIFSPLGPTIGNSAAEFSDPVEFGTHAVNLYAAPTRMPDGGTSNLTCGSTTGTRFQIMDSGAAEWCDGAASTTEYSSPIGGRNLTLDTASQPDEVDADASLYTDQQCIYIESPVTDEEFYTIWRAPIAVTITEIYCEVESGTSVVLNLEVDDGSPTGVCSGDITCDANGELCASVTGDTSMGVADRLDLDFGTVTGTVHALSVCWKYTKND